MFLPASARPRGRRSTWRPPTVLAAFLLVTVATAGCDQPAKYALRPSANSATTSSGEPSVPSTPVATGDGPGSTAAPSVAPSAPAVDGTAAPEPSAAPSASATDGAARPESSAAPPTTIAGSTTLAEPPAYDPDGVRPQRPDPPSDPEPSAAPSATPVPRSAAPEPSAEPSATRAPGTAAPAEPSATRVAGSAARAEPSATRVPGSAAPAEPSAAASGSASAARDAGRPGRSATAKPDTDGRTAPDPGTSGRTTKPGTDGDTAAKPGTGGRTLFVATTGNDGASGAENAPFATLQHAADLTVPGDTVVILAGRYDGQSVTVRRSGTPEKPITYAGRGEVVIAPSDTVFNGVKIEANHIRWRDVTVVGRAREITLREALAQQNSRNSPRTSMNCVFVSPPPGRPDLHPTDIVLSGVAARDCPGSGIASMRAGGDITIEDCTVTGSARFSPFGTSAVSHLLPVGGGELVVRRCRITGNRQEVAAPELGVLAEGHGIIMDRLTDSGFRGTVQIVDNVIEGNGGFAVNIFRSGGCRVVGNRTRGNSTNLPFKAEIVFNRAVDGRAAGNVMRPSPGVAALSVIRSTGVVQENNRVT